jgi:hypothetical protein
MYDAKKLRMFGEHSFGFSNSMATLPRPLASNCGVEKLWRHKVFNGGSHGPVPDECGVGGIRLQRDCAVWAKRSFSTIAERIFCDCKPFFE